jgi:acylphosphatase
MVTLLCSAVLGSFSIILGILADGSTGREPETLHGVEPAEVSMEKRRVRVRIRGMVQGVCFRAFTRDAAVKEGVTGWVMNMRDRSVEAVFEGDAAAIERMIAWCRQGSPYGSVDHVEVKEEVYEGTFDRFEVTYGR